MLTCHVAVQLLLVLLHLLLVKRLKLYYWAAHNIGLLLIVGDVITHLIEPYTGRSERPYRRSIPKNKGPVIGAT